jgi:aryl-alcohol dehydrogenase-like predicted oxidoreductase
MTDDLFDLMRYLKASGMIRAWGVSIVSAEEWLRAIERGAEKELAARVAKLDFLVDKVGSLAEASLRFILSHPAVSTLIPGARTRD